MSCLGYSCVSSGDWCGAGSRDIWIPWHGDLGGMAGAWGHAETICRASRRRLKCFHGTLGPLSGCACTDSTGEGGFTKWGAWITINPRKESKMADRLIFIGWNRPVVGREQQAMKLFQKAMEYYSKLQSGGEIERFFGVNIFPLGGGLNWFFF